MCVMMDDVGGYGYPVIDADGHGGEPLKWRRRIPDAFRSRMVEYVRSMKSTYADVPGGGAQIAAANPREASFSDDELDFDPEMRQGMYDPAARLEDMDLEGIDTTVMFPPGSVKSGRSAIPRSRLHCAARSTTRARSTRPTRRSG